MRRIRLSSPPRELLLQTETNRFKDFLSPKFSDRRRARLALFICVATAADLSPRCTAQQVHLPSGQGQYAELSSDWPQNRQGDVFIAYKTGHLRYAELHWR